MKQNSNYEPVKFDFESGRESTFSCLMAIGLVVAFFVFIVGTGGKHGHPPPNPAIMGTGFLIGLASLIIFGGLRLLTDDYLLVEPGTENVMLCTTFFFKKTTSFFCPFKEVKYVELRNVSRTVKSSHYTDFSLHLIMANDTKQSTDNVSMTAVSGYQFDSSVAKLRDKALQIADIIGCKIKYGDKIPPHERLQSKNLAITEDPSLEEPEEDEFDSIPPSVETADVFARPAENVQSDFTNYEKEKTCPSCGGQSPSQNKYCINCGRQL